MYKSKIFNISLPDKMLEFRGSKGMGLKNCSFLFLPKNRGIGTQNTLNT